MKRRISLLLAVVMILGSFSFAFAADVNDKVDLVTKEGILRGDQGTGALRLDDPLARKEAVVLLSRLMKAEEEAKAFEKEGLPTFTDVQDTVYYKPFIGWAQENDYFRGLPDGSFGFNDNLTAKQYAVVLLRALGYNDEVKSAEGWKNVEELAKKFNLLEDVEVELEEEVTRKDVAVMTFNALGQKMKDSDETLAEFLGIEMPVEKPEKLEAKVYTENLKEVVVELNDASLVDAEKLTDVNKYRVINNTVERVKLDGDKVLVELKNPMTEGRTYELIVRDLHKDIDKKYRVTAKDNVAPEVLEVTSLGEYGIRVTTSEPVRNARERNFLIDGKNVSMRVEEYGRELVLIPYHNTSFPENAQELTIKALEDFAGFKSSEQKFDIKLEKDENGPKVEDVIVKGQDVIVKFDKDVFSKSVSAYESRRQPGNISYEEGRHTITAKTAKKVDIDTVKYNFEGQLPRRADRVDFTIEGVENHSRVEMEKAVVNGRVVMDYSEPIILDSGVHGPSIKYSADGKTADANVKIYFDKEIVGNFKEKSENEFVVKDHLRLFEGEVLGRNDKSEKIVSVKYDGARKDVLVVELKDLVVNTKANNYEFNYILEVENFRDTTSTANRMYRDYVDFEISQAGTAFGIARDKDGKLLPVDVANYIDSRGRELTIYFNKPVDKDIAEDPNNYFFIYDDGSKDDLADLGGKAITERDGLTVSLQIPFFNEKDVVLEILPTLKDVAGVRISGERFFDFNKNEWQNKDATPDEPEQPGKLDDAEITSFVAVNGTAKDNEVLNNPYGHFSVTLKYGSIDGKTIRTNMLESLVVKLYDDEDNLLATNKLQLEKGDAIGNWNDDVITSPFNYRRDKVDTQWAWEKGVYTGEKAPKKVVAEYVYRGKAYKVEKEQQLNAPTSVYDFIQVELAEAIRNLDEIEYNKTNQEVDLAKLVGTDRAKDLKASGVKVTVDVSNAEVKINGFTGSTEAVISVVDGQKLVEVE